MIKLNGDAEQMTAAFGERAVDLACAFRETITKIAAQGLERLHALLAFRGSTNAATFESCLKQVLVPELHMDDIFGFGNLRVHQRTEVSKSVELAAA